MHDRHRFATALGARIRAARLTLGLTQRRVSVLAGLTATGVAYFERGERIPSLWTAARLAAALGVSVSDLCPPVPGD